MSGRSKTQARVQCFGPSLAKSQISTQRHTCTSELGACTLQFVAFKRNLCAAQAPMRSFGGLFVGQEQLGAVEGLQPYQPEWAGTFVP